MPPLRLVFLALACALPARAAGFTVNLNAPLKPVDHAASGALYGIAAPGWPPPALIAAIHPKNFTQMAPGGHQLPNGEKQPVGDALVVAPIAQAAGASVTIRLPDLFPDFPYIWTGKENWTAAIARIVDATVAADPPNIYAYEIWNEPDWNWQAQWGDFDQVWAATYAEIRDHDPRRHVMGPSASKWNEDWMRHFLTAAVANHAVPDIISWHELDPSSSDAIEAHVADFRRLEASLGLAPHPISINEYGAQRDMADPGALVHYIAQFERAGVDTADLAFWHRPGRLSDLLVPKDAGIGPATDPLPTGGYWLYAWYGAMAGQMVAAHGDTGSRLDGFAAYDAGAGRADMVVGGAAGPTSVRVEGLTSFGPVVHVVMETTHWTGTDAAEPAPQPLLSENYAVTAGDVTIPLDIDDASDAVHLVLSRSPSQQVPAAQPVPHTRLPGVSRFEAEAGKITGGRRFAIRMAPSSFGANRASGDAYMGFFNRVGASLTLPVSASAAGSYRLSFGYSNGQASAISATLAVNGTELTTLSFPPTQGRELFGEMTTTADLPAGASTLHLKLAAPVAGIASGPSVLEIDRVDLIPQGR